MASKKEAAWIQQQIKAFVGWANWHLKKKGLEITDISKDLEDGLYLIALLEQITGGTIKGYQRKPKHRIHKITNHQVALQFLKSKSVQLVSCGADDLVDGNIKLLLGLIWTLIRRFHIEDETDENDAGLRISEKAKLLLWVNQRLEGTNIKVKNFTTSFQNGMAFCALVHKLKPELIDMKYCHPSHPKQNLEAAFGAAKKLGIPDLLEPSNLTSGIPDSLSVMTYVSFYRTWHKLAEQEEIQASRELDTEASALIGRLGEGASGTAAASSAAKGASAMDSGDFDRIGAILREYQTRIRTLEADLEKAAAAAPSGTSGAGAGASKKSEQVNAAQLESLKESVRSLKKKNEQLTSTNGKLEFDVEKLRSKVDKLSSELAAQAAVVLPPQIGTDAADAFDREQMEKEVREKVRREVHAELASKAAEEHEAMLARNTAELAKLRAELEATMQAEQRARADAEAAERQARYDAEDAERKQRILVEEDERRERVSKEDEERAAKLATFEEQLAERVRALEAELDERRRKEADERDARLASEETARAERLRKEQEERGERQRAEASEADARLRKEMEEREAREATARGAREEREAADRAAREAREAAEREEREERERVEREAREARYADEVREREQRFKEEREKLAAEASEHRAKEDDERKARAAKEAEQRAAADAAFAEKMAAAEADLAARVAAAEEERVAAVARAKEAAEAEAKSSADAALKEKLAALESEYSAKVAAAEAAIHERDAAERRERDEAHAAAEAAMKVKLEAAAAENASAVEELRAELERNMLDQLEKREGELKEREKERRAADRSRLQAERAAMEADVRAKMLEELADKAAEVKRSVDALAEQRAALAAETEAAVAAQANKLAAEEATWREAFNAKVAEAEKAYAAEVEEMRATENAERDELRRKRHAEVEMKVQMEAMEMRARLSNEEEATKARRAEEEAAWAKAMEERKVKLSSELDELRANEEAERKQRYANEMAEREARRVEENAARQHRMEEEANMHEKRAEEARRRLDEDMAREENERAARYAEEKRLRDERARQADTEREARLAAEAGERDTRLAQLEEELARRRETDDKERTERAARDDAEREARKQRDEEERAALEKQLRESTAAEAEAAKAEAAEAVKAAEAQAAELQAKLTEALASGGGGGGGGEGGAAAGPSSEREKALEEQLRAERAKLDTFYQQQSEREVVMEQKVQSVQSKLEGLYNRMTVLSYEKEKAEKEAEKQDHLAKTVLSELDAKDVLIGHLTSVSQMWEEMSSCKDTDIVTMWSMLKRHELEPDTPEREALLDKIADLRNDQRDLDEDVETQRGVVETVQAEREKLMGVYSGGGEGNLSDSDDEDGVGAPRTPVGGADLAAMIGSSEMTAVQETASGSNAAEREAMLADVIAKLESTESKCAKQSEELEALRSEVKIVNYENQHFAAKLEAQTQAMEAFERERVEVDEVTSLFKEAMETVETVVVGSQKQCEVLGECVEGAALDVPDEAGEAASSVEEAVETLQDQTEKIHDMLDELELVRKTREREIQAADREAGDAVMGVAALSGGTDEASATALDASGGSAGGDASDLKMRNDLLVSLIGKVEALERAVEKKAEENAQLHTELSTLQSEQEENADSFTLFEETLARTEAELRKCKGELLFVQEKLEKSEGMQVEYKKLQEAYAAQQSSSVTRESLRSRPKPSINRNTLRGRLTSRSKQQQARGDMRDVFRSYTVRANKAGGISGGGGAGDLASSALKGGAGGASSSGMERKGTLQDMFGPAAEAAKAEDKQKQAELEAEMAAALADEGAEEVEEEVAAKEEAAAPKEEEEAAVPKEAEEAAAPKGTLITEEMEAAAIAEAEKVVAKEVSSAAPKQLVAEFTKLARAEKVKENATRDELMATLIKTMQEHEELLKEQEDDMKRKDDQIAKHEEEMLAMELQVTKFKNQVTELESSVAMLQVELKIAQERVKAAAAAAPTGGAAAAAPAPAVEKAAAPAPAPAPAPAAAAPRPQSAVTPASSSRKTPVLPKLKKPGHVLRVDSSRLMMATPRDRARDDQPSTIHIMQMPDDGKGIRVADLSIVGVPYEGQVLRAKTTLIGCKAAQCKWQWYRLFKQNPNWKPIPGATKASYYTTVDDISSLIRVACTPHTDTGKELKMVASGEFGQVVISPAIEDALLSFSGKLVIEFSVLQKERGKTAPRVIQCSMDKIKILRENGSTKYKQPYHGDLKLYVSPTQTEFALHLNSKNKFVFDAKSEKERDLIVITVRAFCASSLKSKAR